MSPAKIRESCGHSFPFGYDGGDACAGSITVGRAEAWKSEYESRLSRHRAAIRAETDRLGWSFTIHRTDVPATELLLALQRRLQDFKDRPRRR